MAIPIRRLLWLLGASFAIHEAEEWNLVAWQRAHFTPAPAFDELAGRTLLVLFALRALGFTGLAIRFLRPRRAPGCSTRRLCAGQCPRRSC